ncbi:MAG: DUF1810 domain-containing protein [Thermaurantiacus sp.]
MATDDPFDLERFVRAQEGIFEAAMCELRAGAKRSHWMWFVFPQAAGLGQSDMAHLFAIRTISEAQAYLSHPLLGTRYRQAVNILKWLPDTIAAEAVFGAVDAMKLRSSLTLFVLAAPHEPDFAGALARHFPEGPCLRTHFILATAQTPPVSIGRENC